MTAMILLIGKYHASLKGFILNPKSLGFHPIAKSRLGFTFIEIMVTCAILTMGLVMIYKSFLASLDYQNHMINRYCALTLMESRIAELQRSYWRAGPAIASRPQMPYTKVLNKKPVTFQFYLKLNKVGTLQDISQVNLTISWVEHGRTINLTRTILLSRILPRPQAARLFSSDDSILSRMLLHEIPNG